MKSLFNLPLVPETVQGLLHLRTTHSRHPTTGSKTAVLSQSMSAWPGLVSTQAEDSAWRLPPFAFHMGAAALSLSSGSSGTAGNILSGQRLA